MNGAMRIAQHFRLNSSFCPKKRAVNLHFARAKRNFIIKQAWPPTSFKRQNFRAVFCGFDCLCNFYQRFQIIYSVYFGHHRIDISRKLEGDAQLNGFSVLLSVQGLNRLMSLSASSASRRVGAIISFFTQNRHDRKWVKGASAPGFHVLLTVRVYSWANLENQGCGTFSFPLGYLLDGQGEIIDRWIVDFFQSSTGRGRDVGEGQSQRWSF